MIKPQTEESFETLQRLAQADRPIPGQSLTNDPENPLPFEKTVVHTELVTAIDDLIVRLCDPDIFHPVVNAMRDGLPVSEMAEQILFEGFAQGQFNPDLMLLLVEPTMYILIALADMVDVEPNIVPEDDADSAEEQSNALEKAIEVAKDKVVPKNIPVEIQSKVEKLTKNIKETPISLLSKEEE
jgi:hypothetical protein|tara:strand:- start:4425 stop:4976 length:552 start_codon:yes stop_codon:yes gene_type:complete